MTERNDILTPEEEEAWLWMVKMNTIQLEQQENRRKQANKKEKGDENQKHE